MTMKQEAIMRHKIKYVFALVCACFALCTPTDFPVLATEVSGSVESEETIQPISLSDCTISLSRTVYNYTGKEKRPAITVLYNSQKLTKNKDYTVAYSDNIEVGTAAVTITGMNGYEGTIIKNYTIFPKAPTSVKTSVSAREIDVTWNSQENVDGYILYRRKSTSNKWTELTTLTESEQAEYADEECTYGTTYEYAVRAYKETDSGTLLSDYSKVSKCKYQPAAPTITQLMPTSKTSFSIKWNLEEGADGYFVYQKIDGKWKKVRTVAAYATNHCTIKNLTYKETYSFAVRAYWLSEDGTKQKGSLSQTCKEKLSYKVKYKNGYKLYYDASGDLITNVEDIIGPQEKYLIQINRTTNTVTVLTADKKKKGYSIPVKSFLCSTGTATPKGNFRTTDKYRWHALFHNVYGQWCTRITGNILFHSVYYITNEDANTLDVAEFNKLGTAASAGCIRLCCADTKWIYDNCSPKTDVIIYDDLNPGPFGIPEALILDADHTWDPTDPEMKYLCKENGCHQE